MSTSNLATIADASDPDAVWLIEIAADGTEETFTYRHFQTGVLATHAMLDASGFPTGTRVLLLGESSANYLMSFFGIIRAGMVPVPINPNLSPSLMAKLHGEIGAKIILTDGKCEWGPGAGSYIQLMVQPGSARNNTPAEPATANVTAAILFTSGSTGHPKAVPLCHRSYCWALDVLARWGEPMRGRSTLVAAPLFHMNGLLFSMLIARYGGTQVLLKRFSVPIYLNAIARNGCEVVTAVPTMLAKALRETDLRKSVNLAKVKLVLVGSAPSTERQMQDFQAMFPNALLINGYGTTESGPVTFGPHPEGKQRPLLSLGCATPHVELRLAYGATERDGVLRIRGPCVAPGYLNRPTVTTAKFVDGWYDTGDRMRVDDDGFYFFIGRADDLIVCGGEKFYPNELEEVLLRHSAVAEAAVVALPDDDKHQIPVAFVVRRPNSNASVEELKTFALLGAPAFMHPRFIHFLPEMPTTGPNKVDRQYLAIEANRLFGRMTSTEQLGG